MIAAVPRAGSRTVHRGLVTVSVMSANVMQAIDTTIANIALPHMQGSLSASQDQIAWVLTSYIVAAAVATPLTGWLAGRLGRKRLFLCAVVGFTSASLLCGLATSLTELIVDRLLQGIFGAALVPLSQSTLLDTYPRERHGEAMAIFGAGIMVGPILGPTLGGWLTDTYDWRWVFYINLPVGILAFAGISAFVAETRRDTERPFDFLGFAMLSIAIGALQLMLDRGLQQDWFGSTEIRIECMVAIAGLWMFVVHAATSEHPFVHMALFKDRNFPIGLIVISIVSIILYSTMALVPTFLQTIMGYPALTAGAMLVPRGLANLSAMLIVARLSGHVSPRLMLLFGLAVMSAALWQMSNYSPEMDTGPVIMAGITQGLGQGFVFVPLSTMAFAMLPSSLRTEAAGLYSLVRNIGGSIGISASVTLLAEGTQINHAMLVEHVTPFNAALQSLDIGAAWNLGTQAGLAELEAEVSRQAAMMAYLGDFRLIMLVALVAVPLVFLLRRPRLVAAHETDLRQESAAPAA
ncbi:MAG: DHA2 family efflux MFS transporter permease subunit [Proteobacteria bacterium]|nr:DHA2 family efflux MFS transporter permease subunit [Pseudomonadota bacterium]